MHTKGRANARSQGRSVTNSVGTLLRATVRVCEHIRAFELIDDPTRVRMIGARVRIIGARVLLAGTTFMAAVLSSSCGLASIFARYALT